MLKLLKILILPMIVSCNANWHIKKAMVKKSPQYVIDYITTKYPEFLKQKTDTIRDTTIVISEGFDTTIVTSSRDTIVFRDIKIFRNYDTIILKKETKIDTIFKTIEVPKYIVNKGNEDGWIDYLFLIISIIALSITIYSIMKRIILK